ncbi:MAG: hypothetical protein ACREAM_04365 [Blastocatellia bacterium]
MKSINLLAVASAILLALFLLLRPVIGGRGNPTAPDIRGRAQPFVPDGTARLAAPAPGASPTPATVSR